MVSSQQQGYSGQLGVNSAGSQFSVIAFIVEQLLGDVRTIVPVRVVAVIGGGVGTVPPKVDVLPLVQQIDGNGLDRSVAGRELELRLGVFVLFFLFPSPLHEKKKGTCLTSLPKPPLGND